MKNPFVQLHNLLRVQAEKNIYIPIITVTVLMFCASAWQAFWPNTDPARYQCYALTFWQGSAATNLLPARQCSFLQITTPQAAFHMLPREYPPLTLLPFSLPLLVPIQYYQFAFALMMSASMLITYWFLLRYATRKSAVAFAFYLFLGAYALGQMRYDLLPALLTLLCLIAAERKRWTIAYVLLAFGVLLKLYPLLLLPSLFIAEQQSHQRFHQPPTILSLKEIPAHLWLTFRAATQWRWHNCLLFMGILLIITGAFACFNFNNAVISQILYFAQRPVQIEATGGSLLWIAHKLGMEWWITYSFGSINILSMLDTIVSQFSLFIFLLGVIYILWSQWHRRLNIARAIIALILVFIVTGKVFSPQYLIWLIPLLAYTGAFDSFWSLVWGCISLLTTFTYLFFYSQITDPQHIVLPTGFFETVALRNVFFLLLTLSYLFNWFQAREKYAEQYCSFRSLNSSQK
jgi:hypothetical protein